MTAKNKKNLDKRIFCYCQLSIVLLAVTLGLLPTAKMQLVVGSVSNLLPTANCQPPKGGKPLLAVR